MKKELQGLEEGSEVKIHQESIRATNKYWKTPSYDGIHGF